MSRRTVLAACLLLVLLLPAAGAGLVATETGTRWILALASRMGGEQISVEHVSGTLLSPIELARIEVRYGAHQVQIRALALDWRPLALLSGTAHVRRLALDHVFYRSQTGDEAQAQQPGAVPDNIRLPVAVQADEIHIEDVRFARGDSADHLKQVRIRDLHGDREVLSFSSFEATGGGFHLTTRARMAAAPPHALKADFAWTYRLPQGITAGGDGELSGSLETLKLTHRLRAPFDATLEGTVMPLATPPRAAVRVQWRNLQWPLEGAAAIRSESGHIVAEGSPGAMQLRLDARIDGGGVPVDGVRVDANGGIRDNAINAAFRWTAELGGKGRAAGRGKLAGDTARLTLEHLIEEPVQVATRGDMVFTGDTLELALDGEWANLRWPLSGDADISSASGRYRLRGPLDRLRVGMHGKVRSRSAKITGAEVDLEGHASARSPFAFDAGVDWRATFENAIDAAGRLTMAGDIHRIKMEKVLQAPFAAEAGGEVLLGSDAVTVRMAGHWQDARWPLSGAPRFVSPHGEISLQGPIDALDLSASANLGGAGLPPATARVDARLRPSSADLRSLRVETLGGSIGARGEATLDPEAMAVRMEGQWRDLQWPPSGTPDYASKAGQFTLEGPVDGLEVMLSGEFAGPKLLTARARLEGRLQPSGANIRSLLFETLGGEIRAQGEAVLDPEATTVRMEGQWQALQWPPSGTPDYASKAGQFTLEGPVDGLEVTLSGDFGGPKLPAARARLDGRLQPSSAGIRSLLIETLGGDIRARGEVGWEPAPAWRLEVNAAGLRPQFFAPDWPGEISIDAGVSGTLAGEAPRIGIELKELEGRLRGYPVRGGGSLTIDGSRISASDFALNSGENSLRLDGEVSDHLDLSFVIDAPSLQAFAPQLGGSLKASGALAGTRARPRVTATFAGADIAWKENRMRTLSLDLTAATDPGHRSQIALHANGIRIGDAALEHVTVDGAGTPESHRLQITAEAPAATLSATADGGLRENTWTGLLDAGLSTRNFGDWRLQRPAPVRASPEGFSADLACLIQGPAAICADGEWKRAGGAVRAGGEIRALPLALASPWLPGGIGLEGPLNGAFSLGGRVDAAEAEIRIAAPEGALSYRPGDDLPPAEFRFREASLNARHHPSGTRVDLRATLENAGQIEGVVDIGPAGGDASAPLRGRLDADFTDLAWLGVLAPQVTDAGGDLKAGLDLGGTTARPAVSGEATLRGGRANLPDLGIALRDIDLSLRNRSPGHYVLEGELTSGGGRVEIRGESAPDSSGNQQVEVSLQGREVEIARLPAVHAFASPDLRLQADANSAVLTGEIHVPRAKIVLKQLPESAVAVSTDEVIVGQPQTENRQGALPGARTRITVDVTLGEEVEFEGFGLTAGVNGNLTLSGESGQLPTAQGVLSLRDGRYDAYGQRLSIERGRLLFTGPADNPDIDVTAVRKAGDVTAGIAISGKIRSIESRVFSDPPMPDADAFSYLLTGRPLSEGTKSDAAMLSSAALSLGLQRSQLITRQIGASLGLDELAIGGDDVAGSSLLLGKQLTPDLFVRYALGVFEQSGKLLLNYRLTDSLSLEAESGEQQGVDLIYQIEREQLF